MGKLIFFVRCYDYTFFLLQKRIKNEHKRTINRNKTSKTAVTEKMTGQDLLPTITVLNEIN